MRLHPKPLRRSPGRLRRTHDHRLLALRRPSPIVREIIIKTLSWMALHLSLHLEESRHHHPRLFRRWRLRPCVHLRRDQCLNLPLNRLHSMPPRHHPRPRPLQPQHQPEPPRLGLRHLLFTPNSTSSHQRSHSSFKRQHTASRPPGTRNIPPTHQMKAIVYRYWRPKCIDLLRRVSSRRSRVKLDSGGTTVRCFDEFMCILSSKRAL